MPTNENQMRVYSSEMKREIFGLYNDAPMPPFLSFLDPQVKVPPKNPWITEGLPIEVSKAIRNSSKFHRLPPLPQRTSRFTDFLVAVLLSLPSSGFENQLPKATNFGAREDIPSYYVPLPQDVSEMNFAQVTRIPPKLAIENQNRSNITMNKAVNQQKILPVLQITPEIYMNQQGKKNRKRA
uniref:Uncharacterized protein n=1 Tax=Acrobeloides nanus TaxID=290746 RepID=A0A914EM86_9BILA